MSIGYAQELNTPQNLQKPSRTVVIGSLIYQFYLHIYSLKNESSGELIEQRFNEKDWDLYWNGRISWPKLASISTIQFPYGFDELTQNKYKDSIDLLNKFKSDYRHKLETSDLVLVGCGAYSIPLLAWAKEYGKVGIHLGGTIQLLFGIKGGAGTIFLICITSIGSAQDRNLLLQPPKQLRIVVIGSLM
jgi:hypothetical protein